MRSHTFIGIIIILLGLSILFNIPFFSYLIAFVILWLGIKVLMGEGASPTGFTSTRGVIHDDFLRRVLIFSGISSKLESDDYEGTDLVSVFGGGKLDASGVKTSKKEVDIELVAIFGGLKMKLPKGWSIKNEGVAIFGGFNDNTRPSPKTGVVVHLKGVAIFGGVEIVN
jgi:hypothetical protein